MAETIIWCNMIVTIFYILSIIYMIQLHFVDNFNPVGKEFTSLVMLGLLTILHTSHRTT
jgi:hypothetical protein